MRKLLLPMWGVICIMLACINTSFAQQNGVIRCATMEQDAILRANNPNLGTLEEFEQRIAPIIKENKETGQGGANFHIVDGVYIIPIVVHVIHDGEPIGTGDNISYALIESQIETLNDDFRRRTGTNGFNNHPDGADTKIEFRLAQRRPDGSGFGAEIGVNRIDRNAQGWGAPPYGTGFIDGTIKPFTTVTQGYDGAVYMNFWCVDISGGILGYAQFPQTTLGGMDCDPVDMTTDGVVMTTSSVGGETLPSGGAPYNLGRTATHEIGHWLGLRHIWGDPPGGVNGCTVDDFCADTPNAASSNFGCATGTNSCTDSPVDAPDMVENYMDYSDDACMNIFTNDQAIRMRTILETFRFSLINSEAAIPPNADDAGVLAVLNPVGDACSSTVTPSIRIKNYGTSNLTSITIEYGLDGSFSETQTFNTINVAQNGTLDLTLNDITGVTQGAHTFEARSVLPNGVADPFTDSDLSDSDFTLGNGALPIVADFEGSSFPPASWQVQNPDNDCNLWVADGTPTLVDSDGNRTVAALLRHHSYTGSGQEDILVSPAIDLTGAGLASAAVEFDVAYRRRNATASERLVIEVSTDCGVTWNPTAIYDKAGDALATVTPASTSAFFPTSATNWRRESASLNAYIGQSIKVRFVTTNDNGNNLWIDNIRIYDARPEVQFNATTGTITENSSTGTVDCRGYQDVSIPVDISLAPPSDVTVNVTATAGTMTAGQDYVLQTPTLTFTNGSATSQNVVVRVFDDNALEAVENLELTLAVVGTDAILGTNNVHTLTVNDNDDITLLVTQTLFEENFEGQTLGVPSAGWTVADVTTGSNVWVFGENGGITGNNSAYITNNTTSRLPEYSTGSTSRTRLVSPAINTVGSTNLQLSFNFKVDGESYSSGNVYDYGRLMYSTSPTGPFTNITGPADNVNGTPTTVTLVDPFVDNPNTTAYSVTLPAACENQATLYLVWRWDNDGSVGTNPPFTIDDIVLTGSSLQQYPVEDATASKQVYLGPNSTVYVISSNNKVMAKLENTTTHDYGCTTVAIDRAGTGQVAYTNAGASNGLTEKSLLITPTTPSTENIGVTLYYTDAEKTGWETATGKSWTTDAKMQRTGGAISNVTPATPNANGATNTAHAITSSAYLTTNHAVAATINNGFGNGNAAGGLAIGDPLPCSITGISLVSQTACANDRYTATVTVTYSNPAGSLVVNGQTFTTTTSPQTVTLTNLVADGNDVDVTASFSTSCTFTSTALFTAPAACGITGGGGGAPPVTVGTPTQFRAEGISTSQINLSWTAVSGATGYVLYIGNTVISNITSGATTSFEHTGLNPDTFYSYRLIALNGAVQSQAAQANASTFPEAPTVVSTTSTCGTGSAKIVLSGSGSVFNVYVEETGGVLVAQTANATFVTPTISQNTTYYISVVGLRGLESSRTRVEAIVETPIEATIEEGTSIRSCDASTTLTANRVDSATYAWLVNGVVIDDTNSNVFTVTRNGNYQVRITRGICTTTSSFTNVTLNYAPTAEIINGVTANFCDNGTLRAVEAANATYSWTLDSVVVGTEREVFVTESGQYTLTVTEDGCSATDQIQVVVTSLPSVSVVASDSTFCPGSEVTLTADEIAGVTYNWSRNGRVVRRDAGNSIDVSTAGEYIVTIEQNGCSRSSASINIERLSVPPAYLRETEETLFVESEATISNVVWVFEGEQDASLSGETITPTESGNYSALVTYENGCSIQTRTVFFRVPDPVVVGEEEEVIKALRIYPNPSADGIFQIDLGQNTDPITLILTDQLGRVLETIELPKDATSYQLNLTKYASALYTIQLKSEKGVVTRKIVIEK
ncbi:T9SS-dependent choice-of-anchor J family protein [Bernardetia sp.]|uniref:T9SS-dependent choice-of-anchor J family protein n=1 Tax=Bernardetia sp. TaxID=1937974 RepID=UPI0025BE9288|nr:choice-of-anchor J domain-containing protein [Bernardetia sp.]